MKVSLGADGKLLEGALGSNLVGWSKAVPGVARWPIICSSPPQSPRVEALETASEGKPAGILSFAEDVIAEL